VIYLYGYVYNGGTVGISMFLITSITSSTWNPVHVVYRPNPHHYHIPVLSPQYHYYLPLSSLDNSLKVRIGFDSNLTI